MPSAPIVSRTITVTVANVLELNLKTRKTKRTKCTIVGTFDNKADLVVALRNYYNGIKGKHFAHVTSWKEETNLYVQDPQFFIEHAEKRELRKGTKQVGGPTNE